jgi:hypothetical protein
MDSGTAFMMAVVALMGVLALLVAVVVLVAARGRARAGLLPVAMTAALVGPVAGIGAATYGLSISFSESMTDISGQAIRAACAQATPMLQVGCGAAALTLLVAIPLGWVGRAAGPPLPAASPRRLLVLALPALVAPLLVGGTLEYARRTRATVLEILDTTPPPAPVDEEAELEGEEDEEVARPSRVGEIAALTRRLSTGLLVGTLGLPWHCLVLLGFAAATAIIAWRVQVPAAFGALLSGWMLLQALLWLGAILLVRTPAPPA